MKLESLRFIKLQIHECLDFLRLNFQQKPTHVLFLDDYYVLLKKGYLHFRVDLD